MDFKGTIKQEGLKTGDGREPDPVPFYLGQGGPQIGTAVVLPDGTCEIEVTDPEVISLLSGYTIHGVSVEPTSDGRSYIEIDHRQPNFD